MVSRYTFFWTVLVASGLGAGLGVISYSFFLAPMQPRLSNVATSPAQSAYYTSYIVDTIQTSLPQGINFVYAAQNTIPSVVHVRVSKEQLNRSFLGILSGEKLYDTGSGSGVIISADGYIVTNNHVVAGANKVEIILSDNRAFEADLIGTDSFTDLALLHIEATGLKAVPLGDSDELDVGSWVLAVGNPFELRSTVTAGIVSAKERDIRSINSSLGIESFIQTDAVVNRGNSGGALVNLRGELVGINTAIYTETGGYDGYSFAVPVSLVKKVTQDLRQHGKVQRALLGIVILNVNAALAEEKKLAIMWGVFVEKVTEGSASAEAGLLAEDIITAVDDEEVFTIPQLQEKIALHRPGDRVSLSILRQGRRRRLSVTLKGLPKGPTDTRWTTEEEPWPQETPRSLQQQLPLSSLSIEEKKNYAISHGVKVLAIRKQAWKSSGLRPGFVIMQVNGHIVRQPQDMYHILALLKPRSKVTIEGIYLDGTEASYSLLW